MQKIEEMNILNFRDLSKFNEKIKSNVIYRSSALCLVKEEKLLEKELTEKNIMTIVDFRADREIEENSYSKEFHCKFNIVHAPFDPWNQSIEFQNTYNTGTNVEIAYKFFSYECKDSIKKVILAILNTTDSIVIHCHAGKDRTGIFATILHLLVDGLNDSIYTDYLASKMDTRIEYIDIFLNIVEESGNIVNYLESCNLSLEEINNLKNRVSQIC